MNQSTGARIFRIQTNKEPHKGKKMKFKATICLIYQFAKRFIKPQRKFHLKCQTGQLASKVMPIIVTFGSGALLQSL